MLGNTFHMFHSPIHCAQTRTTREFTEPVGASQIFVQKRDQRHQTRLRERGSCLKCLENILNLDLGDMVSGYRMSET